MSMRTSPDNYRERTKNKRPRRKLLGLYFLVPRAGIEPAHPKVQDFESSASTSSATEAFQFAVRLTASLTVASGCKNKELFQFSKCI